MHRDDSRGGSCVNLAISKCFVHLYGWDGGELVLKIYILPQYKTPYGQLLLP